MKRILVILLLICITLIPSITSPLASGGEHTTKNGLPRDVYYIRVHTGLTWRYIGSWSKKPINQIYALNGGNTWVGYSSGGFSIPDSGSYESYTDTPSIVAIYRSIGSRTLGR